MAPPVVLPPGPPPSLSHSDEADHPDHPGGPNFFEWKFSSVFIFFWAALAVGMVSIAVAAESLDFVFGFGYVCFVLALVWSLGWWFTSDFLRNRRPRGTAWNRWRIRFVLWRWGGAAAMTALIAWSALFSAHLQYLKRLERMKDVLLPAADPTPEIPAHCRRIPEGALLVFYGDSLSFATRFPFHLFSVNGLSLLSIDKRPDGALSINALVKARDGRVIASISDNEFVINKNSILDFSRPDRSTLLIRDEHGDAALRLRFLNTHSVMFTGILRYGTGTGDALIVNDHSYTVLGVTLEQSCLSGLGISVSTAPGRMDFQLK
jgi:hypothetical protein